MKKQLHIGILSFILFNSNVYFKPVKIDRLACGNIAISQQLPLENYINDPISIETIQFSIKKNGKTYYLAGHPNNKSVRLTTNKNLPEAKWNIFWREYTNMYSFKLSNSPSNKWLNAVTKESRITLKPHKYGETGAERWTGTRWEVISIGNNKYKLRGHGKYKSYLYIIGDVVKLDKSKYTILTISPNFNAIRTSPKSYVRLQAGDLCGGIHCFTHNHYINNHHTSRTIRATIAYRFLNRNDSRPGPIIKTVDRDVINGGTKWVDCDYIDCFPGYHPNRYRFDIINANYLPSN